MSNWQPPRQQNGPPGMYESRTEAVLKLGCACALGIVFLAASIGVAIVILKIARGL